MLVLTILGTLKGIVGSSGCTAAVLLELGVFVQKIFTIVNPAGQIGGLLKTFSKKKLFDWKNGGARVFLKKIVFIWL